MSDSGHPPWNEILRPVSHSEELVDFHIALLENLFGAIWFETDVHRKRNHPAFRRWQLCRTVKHLGGRLIFPEHRAIVPDMASMLLDNVAIAQCSGGDRLGLSLGEFANYGDLRVRTRIGQALQNPDSFLSLMTEFGYAASHLLAKRSIRAFEDEGLADFSVTDPALEYPLYTDVKRIASGTSVRRYKHLLDKINKQVKASKIATGEAGYGLGFIDITNHVPSEHQVHSDSVPSEVSDIRDLVQHLLRKFYSSVSGIVLSWDSHEVIGSPVICLPRDAFARRLALVVMVRRNVVIRHKQPLLQLPNDDKVLRSEYTITFSVGGGSHGI